jgi:hypothetical protein
MMPVSASDPALPPKMGAVPPPSNSRRTEWCIAALRPWSKGPQGIAFLFVLFAYPVLLFIIQRDERLPDGLVTLIQSLGMFIAAPALAVIATLLSVEGKGGIARAQLLREVPGGPVEWVRAKLFAARSCAFVLVSGWGLSSVLICVGPDVDWARVALGYALLIAWAIPLIVTEVRLSIANHTLGSLVLWGLTMWPGAFMYDEGTKFLNYGSITSQNTEVIILASLVGLGIQGMYAHFRFRNSLQELALTPV